MARMSNRNPATLPDVAGDAVALARPLDWVGMEHIALPVRIPDGAGGQFQVAADVDVAVDLADAGARGIHMSRLYLQLQEGLAREPITPAGLRHLLQDGIASQQGLATQARLCIRYDALLQRPALESGFAGWKRYPVDIEATLAEGHLRLALVSCPIALYPATSSGERISFRQINKKTGNRLRQQLVDEDSREAVEPQDKGRGYEVAKGQYIQVEDDELDAIQVESTHTIEIEKFIPLSEIDVRYFDSPYYLIPDDQVGLDAFSVIRDAMASKKMVGIGHVVLQKRERPILLEAFGKGIRGMTLRYPYEVRSETEYFQDIPDLKIAPDMLKLAQHIIDTKAAHFEPSAFVDRYEIELVELLKKKQAGLPPKKTEPRMPRPTGSNIFDLLRRSVELEDKPKRTKAPPLQPALAKKKAARPRARA